MNSWECDFAGQGQNAHEHYNGEKKTGSLGDSLVIVWECSCACHGEGRDGHEIRRYHDHGEQVSAEA